MVENAIKKMKNVYFKEPTLEKSSKTGLIPDF